MRFLSRGRAEGQAKGLLLAGAVYFLLVSVAHMTGIKLPVLFIYYSLPSYEYQDRIIGFLTFGWSVFFYMTVMSFTRRKLGALVIAGLVALVMLVIINLTTDFSGFPVSVEEVWFHVGVLVLFFYWLLLLRSYVMFR